MTNLSVSLQVHVKRRSGPSVMEPRVCARFWWMTAWNKSWTAPNVSIRCVLYCDEPEDKASTCKFLVHHSSWCAFFFCLSLPQWSPNASWWRLRYTELKRVCPHGRILEESRSRRPLWTTMASMTQTAKTTANSRPSSATTQRSAGVSTALVFVVLTRETKISCARSSWRPSEYFILINVEGWLTSADVWCQVLTFFFFFFFSSWVRLQLTHKPVNTPLDAKQLKTWVYLHVHIIIASLGGIFNIWQ